MIMPVHESDDEMLPDEAFLPGSLKYLVPGNECRLLDGRRTPGVIERLDLQSAMFSWRITKFEDAGKTWCLPAEDVNRYQFAKDSQELEHGEIFRVQAEISKYQESLIIRTTETERIRTEQELLFEEKKIKRWMKDHSRFIQMGMRLDFDDDRGPELLADDLIDFMEQMGFLEQEIRTSENIVLNPHSGEWIKGMEIVLAEMGLLHYVGKITRSKAVFEGSGQKVIRKAYLLNRLGFIRAYFNLLGISEVVLYRGMSTEREWEKRPRSLLSCTFNLNVAKSFANYERNSKYRSAYLAKFTSPVQRLFMTYLETRAMNQQYKEAEAFLLTNPQLDWLM